MKKRYKIALVIVVLLLVGACSLLPSPPQKYRMEVEVRCPCETPTQRFPLPIGD